jgi:ABC-type siderophore export system fused ATPase/permease subunit
MAAMITDETVNTNEKLEKAMNKTKYFIPLYILVPIAFWMVFHYSGIVMNWQAFSLGALGWVIALFLRGPLSAIVMKMPKEKAYQSSSFN